MGLADVYNVRLSSVLDNMQPVVNAFLALYGMQSTTQRDIEQVSAAKERAFTDRLRALLTVLTAGKRLLGRSVDLTGGEVTFYKNLPQDNATLAEALLSVPPLLLRRTILENLPWVADVQEELQCRAVENG